MTTLLDKDEFEAALAKLGVEAINKAGIGNQSGQLRNTLRVEATPEGYLMTFEPYGLYLDAGVKGVKSGNSGRGYEGKFYEFSNRYKMIGGNLGGQGPAGYAIRTAIHNKGIAAKPWIERALQLITEGGAELIEVQVTKKIDEYISRSFPRTEVQITL